MTIHLPAETALALAMALTDTRYDLHAKRLAAEAAIEDLINFLDDTEGDPDLEPSLGWNGYIPFDGADAIDLEFDDCDLEDDGAAEPSLAAPEMTFGGVDYFHSLRTMIVSSAPTTSQDYWARGSSGDGEENVEDEGEATNEDGGDILDEAHDADCDLEPDLTFNWGLGSSSSEFDGPRDCETKEVRDRPEASRLAALAKRMARAKAVA